MPEAPQTEKHEQEFDLALQRVAAIGGERISADEFHRRAGDNPFVSFLCTDDLDRCLAAGGAQNLLPAEPPGEFVLFVNESLQPPFKNVRLPTLSELENITDLDERAQAIFAMRLNATCDRSKALIESVAGAGVVGILVQAGFVDGDGEPQAPRHPFYGRRRSYNPTTANLFKE